MRLPRRRGKAKPTPADNALNEIVQLMPMMVAASVIASMPNGLRVPSGLGLSQLDVATEYIDEAERVTRALINMAIPLPSIELQNDGIIAFRQWELGLDGWLRSTSQHHIWRELEFADELPNESNHHGLYATRIDPMGLSSESLHQYLPIGSRPNTLNSVESCGLAALSGTVIEHEDGVYRAECARILCIWVVSCSPYTYEIIPKLYDNYPTIPIYVCNRRQVVETLFLLAAMRLNHNVVQYKKGGPWIDDNQTTLQEIIGRFLVWLNFDENVGIAR